MNGVMMRKQPHGPQLLKWLPCESGASSINPGQDLTWGQLSEGATESKKKKKVEIQITKDVKKRPFEEVKNVFKRT